MSDYTEILKGQSVIITGGASGIGKASAMRFAKAGARIAIVDINEQNIKATRDEITAQFPGVETIGIKTDIRFPDQVDAMAAQVNSTFGRIDILVHSAGILRPAGSSPRILPQMEMSECDALIDINLKGTFLCDRAVLQYMMTQRSGQILNIASTSGLKGIAFDSVYCASKFGVVGLTESLAEEVRQFGVRVHLLLPDAVATPLWDNNIAGAPAGSLSPDRVAHVIEFMLCMPEDMILPNVVVAPFKSRRKKKKES